MVAARPGIALHHLVDGGDRLAEIFQHVVQAALARSRHPVAIEHGDRPDRDGVDRPVDREDEPVGPLQRIPRLVGPGVAAQPVRATAAASARAEWRTFATYLKKPSTIDAENPQKRLCFAVVAPSVAHAAFTLKTAQVSCFSLADINIFLYVFNIDGSIVEPFARGGGGHAAAHPGPGGAGRPDRQRLRACAGAKPAARLAASEIAGRRRPARALSRGAVHPLPAGDRRRRCHAGARVRAPAGHQASPAGDRPGRGSTRCSSGARRRRLASSATMPSAGTNCGPCTSPTARSSARSPITFRSARGDCSISAPARAGCSRCWRPRSSAPWVSTRVARCWRSPAPTSPRRDRQRRDPPGRHVRPALRGRELRRGHHPSRAALCRRPCRRAGRGRTRGEAGRRCLGRRLLAARPGRTEARARARPSWLRRQPGAGLAAQRRPQPARAAPLPRPPPDDRHLARRARGRPARAAHHDPHPGSTTVIRSEFPARAPAAAARSRSSSRRPKPRRPSARCGRRSSASRRSSPPSSR